MESLYFFLFSDVLVYGERAGSSSSKEKRYNYRRTVTILGASEWEHESGEQYCLQVISPEKALLLFADSDRQRKSWVREINECAEKMKAQRKNLRARGASGADEWQPSGLGQIGEDLDALRPGKSSRRGMRG